MSLLRALRGGLRSLFRRNIVERELDDEVRHYLEMATQENMRAGMSRAAAERAARIAFGGVEDAKEGVRGGGWEAYAELLWRDVRHGSRSLRRHPTFAVVVTLTLALGIGVNTAMFSVVDAVLLRPLPFKDPNRLAMLWTADPRRGIFEEGTSYPTFNDWARQSRLFAGMALCSRGQLVNLLGGAEPERVNVEAVTTNLFPLLGVTPSLGRGFTVDDEAQKEPVVVISDGLWRRRFGASPAAIGAWLDVEGTRAQVIGVMPPGFYFPSKNTHLWSLFNTSGKEGKTRFDDSWRVVGRLRPDVTLADAQAEMSAIGSRLARAFPDTPAGFVGFGVNVVPMLEQFTGRSLTLALWVLLGAVGFVLAIACVNVANLQLARGVARLHEFGVRAALGATRGRLVRQLFVESLWLALLAGVFGAIVAMLCIELLGATAPAGIARLDEVRIDGRMLGFAASLAVLCALIFGLVPAWRIAFSDPNEVLKRGNRAVSESRVTRRARELLVVAEFALAMTLLIGAGLFVRSLVAMQSRDPGFRAEGVALARVSIPLNARLAPDGRTTVHETYQEILDRVATLPGVSAVGTISNFVLTRNADLAITIRDVGTPARGQLSSEIVSPGFFQAMRVPLLRGRYFTRDEGRMQANRTFAIVNESFARRYFADVDPVGHQFREGGPTDVTKWVTIVGVVGDIRRRGLEREPVAEVYYPGTMWWIGTADLVVRTSGDPTTLAASLKREIRAVEGSAVVTGVTTLDRQMRDLDAQRRFQTWLLGAFATMALALAAIGIYGVQHFTVTQRTREIGIRVAFGATAARIVASTLGEGLRLAIIGLGLGVAASVFLTRVVSNLLLDVSPTDPWTFVAVAIVLGTAAVAASYLPARRAALVDPTIALRHE